MSKIQSPFRDPEGGGCALPGAAPDPARAARMRGALSEALQGLQQARMALLRPHAQGGLVPHGSGHFHSAPELFVQLAGWTRFEFPGRSCRLEAGEALLLPPQLLHAEQVGPGPDGQAFCNLVLYADAQGFSSHLASEQRPGLPGVQHLETRRTPQAGRMQAWLLDACPRAGLPPSDWDEAQARALVSATLASALRLLAQSTGQASEEHPLVARVKLWVKNRLGEQDLSVRGLAQQAGCTADYLSQLFHRHTGEHLVAHIVRLRMERAAQLLLDGRMAGKAVAWACGYASHSYFTQSFRQHHGATPTAWRRSQPAPPA
ncbi:helix-turn-helix domain-containing protein [Ramlibacter sp. 2FC]|uniref:AraC family transcriptional regulator n=1 Tax=Ramlibacter sp. 2FC TaxID=2502188 RepID=UPI001BB28386|nr:helix-turn-helix domain-containing protein [Ramlibacter sp. 2FC]